MRNSLTAFLTLLSLALRAQGTLPTPERLAADEARAAARFDSVRRDPLLLRAFLHGFPKGGDLHNHLGGAVYAESYIRWAADLGMCVDLRTFTLLPGDSLHTSPAGTRMLVRDALANGQAYRAMIDALSMRNFRPLVGIGSNQFFDTFGKFGAAGGPHLGDMLAEVVHRAATENESYLELMVSLDGGEAREIMPPGGLVGDVGKIVERIVRDSAFTAILARCSKRLDAALAHARDTLHCAGASPDPGCGTAMRFVYQIGRAVPLDLFFAQTLIGFAMASRDPRIVGLDIVQPEESYLSMQQFTEEMRIIGYLHGVFPKAHISLHAGELAFGLVPPDELGTHIRASVETGKAERIGHGVDVFYDRDPAQLLQEMKEKHVAVEICLTSNDVILGVTGAAHPFPKYRAAGVPTVICTDDEGVSRSDMTHEYQRAVEGYALTYADIKDLARNSLRYSFLSGESAWTKYGDTFPRSAPVLHYLRGEKLDEADAEFFNSSEKARMELDLERRFAVFEGK